VSGGESGTAELLRDDGYVLRWPSERESRLASGELNEQVVTMTDSGAWAYRVDITTEQLTETAHTAFAVGWQAPRATSARLSSALGSIRNSLQMRCQQNHKEILEQAIAEETYTEEAPITEAFERLLDLLGLGRSTQQRMANNSGTTTNSTGMACTSIPTKWSDMTLQKTFTTYNGF